MIDLQENDKSYVNFSKLQDKNNFNSKNKLTDSKTFLTKIRKTILKSNESNEKRIGDGLY